MLTTDSYVLPSSSLMITWLWSVTLKERTDVQKFDKAQLLPLPKCRVELIYQLKSNLAFHEMSMIDEMLLSLILFNVME